MRVISLLFFALLLLSLSACEITQVKGKIGGVGVEVKDEDSKKSSDNFCPPGQGKKSNC